jgi:PAS domain S-box-containing protein
MKARNENLLARFQTLPPATVIAIALLHLAVVGTADFYLPYNMRFTLLYIVGVAFLAWCTDPWLAFAGAMLTSVVSTTIEFTTAQSHLSIPIQVWNESSRTVIFIATGYFTAIAGNLARRLNQLVEERTKTLRLEAEQHKSTAAKLAETVERFEQVVNNITEVFWLADVDKKQVLYVSPGYERIWGRKCAEVYRDASSWVAAMHPDDREPITRRSLTEQARGGYDVEYRILRPDGEVRWIRDRAFPVRNAQGEVYRIAGITGDITERRQTRELLKTQAAILENMAEGVVVTNEQGLILQMNPAAERIWGYNRAEVIGQPTSVFSALPEPEATAVMREVLSALKASGSWHGIFHNRRKDGALIFCEAKISRLEIHGRTLMVAVEQDITERKRSEQHLRQSEETLRTFLHALPEPAMLLDRQGLVLVGNRTFAQKLGRPGESLVGQCVFDLLPPEVAARRKAIFEQVVATGKAARLMDTRADLTFVNWFSPALDPKGRVSQVAVIAFDVTERQRAEDALRQSEETLRALLNAAPVPAFLLDKDGMILVSNPVLARSLGVPGTDLTGKYSFGLLPPDIGESRKAAFERVLRSRQLAQYEDSRAGRHFVNIQNPVLDAAGNVTRVAVFALDVTERKQAEQALREAHDALERRVQERTAELQAANKALSDSEARLRLALDASNAGTWSWDMATNTSEWDERYHNMYGFEPHSPRSFDAWITSVHPDDRPRLLAQIQKLQQPGAGTSWDQEFRVLHPVKGERWMAGLGRVERDPTGRAVRFTGIGLDITERKRMEQALRAQLAYIEAIYQTAPVGLCVLDPDLRYLRVNERLAAINGRPAAEHIGHTVRDVVPNLADPTEAMCRQVIATGQAVIGLELQGTTDAQPGVLRTGMAHCVPLKAADGRVTGLSVLVQETTERKRMVEALRQAHDQLETRVQQRTAELQAVNAALAQSEERYRSLVTNLNVGVYRTTPGPHGRYLHANPALARMYGSDSVEELMQRNVSDSYQEPDDRIVFMAELLRRGSLTNYELRLKRNDGTPVYASVNATVHRGPDGEADWIDGVLEDITERKLAQEALRASEERYRTLAESSPDAIFILDRDIRVQYVNPAAAAFWHREPQDLIGLTQTELFPAEIAQRQANAVSAVFETGNPLRRERPVAFPIGQRWVEIRLAPLCGAHGTVTAIMGICRDTTERKRAEQQLAETLELNQQILAASPLGIAAFQASGECVFTNQALADLVGGTVSEVLQTNFRHLATWQHTGLLRLADESLAAGGPRATECHFTTTFGKEAWLTVIMAPFTRGGQRHLLCLHQEIGARKRAEVLVQAQRDLAVVLSQTSDLKAGPEQLLGVAMQIAGMDSGGVYLLNEATGGMDLAVTRGTSPAFIEAVSHWAADSPQMNLVRSGQPFFGRYEDLPFAKGEPRRREGMRATAFVPLCHDGKPIGTLALSSHETEEIPLPTRLTIEAIAAQAAGAIARIRTEQALRQSETRLRAIVTGAPILLFAVDQEGIIRFEDGKALQALGAKPGQNVGRPVAEVYGHIPAIPDHARRALAGEEFEALVDDGRLALDCWYSPVRDPDGKPAGYIGVGTNISDRHRLERQILEISDREHARIGQDLHDSLCQQLVSLALDANSLKHELAAARRPEARKASRISDYLDRAITEARQLARGLYPVRLAQDGLPSALEEMAAATRERFKIRCRFAGKGPVTLKDNAMATHLYRIAQEAVSNAVRHGRARSVTIRLCARAGTLELNVEDDGAGLSATRRRETAGMGLHIMDYRARMIGGTFQIGPGVHRGTKVCCCVPLPGGGK